MGSKTIPNGYLIPYLYGDHVINLTHCLAIWVPNFKFKFQTIEKQPNLDDSWFCTLRLDFELFRNLIYLPI